MKKNGGVSCIGVLFIPCFVKIGQLVSKLKLTRLDSLAFSESYVLLSISGKKRWGMEEKFFLGGGDVITQ